MAVGNPVGYHTTQELLKRISCRQGRTGKSIEEAKTSSKKYRLRPYLN